MVMVRVGRERNSCGKGSSCTRYYMASIYLYIFEFNINFKANNLGTAGYITECTFNLTPVHITEFYTIFL